MTSVFEVDREGLRKLLERKGKEFVLYELIQNAWDQNVREVYVSFTKSPGSRLANIVVEDDDPEGFADLTHAYTLFAESAKKSNPRQRGRFNIGEKLVIAVCEESRIVTTKGGVEFVGDERRVLRRKTEKGSRFEGLLRLTNDEFAACCNAMTLLLPPAGIMTYFNGSLLEPREPQSVVERVSLQTEIADAEGYLRKATRSTEIRIYERRSSEVGMLFEMGIPVVPTRDEWHVDVQQKIPLTTDRDNVPPSFLRDIRTVVLNQVHQHLTETSANHLWVKSAMEDSNVSEDAVRSVIKNRFGDKVVTYDIHDQEANHRAVAEGFTVVYGRSLGKEEWNNVRKVIGVMPSAGSLFPTDPGNIVPMVPIEPTEQEAKMITGIKRLARTLIGAEIAVDIINNHRENAAARYGHRHMMVNKAKVGRKWFDALDEASVGLIIHELGHEYETNHLLEGYYRALTKLGARLAIATAKDPTLLVLV